METRADKVFKAIIDAQWDVLSSGGMDAPTGLFSVVEIPDVDGERTEMQEAVFEGRTEAFEALETGYYFVVQRVGDNPLTYEKCKNRDYAFARFNLARAAYEAWMDNF